MSKESVIEIKGLNISFQNKRVLSNIYLNIESGETYGLIGPNGAGKSTLFKSILGILEYSSGEVLLFGQPIDKVRKRVAYVPQRDDVDWTFPATVLDVVLMGRYPYKKVLQRLNTEDYAIARESLDNLGIADLENRQIGQLSGGQQQRVFIARAICQRADIYLFDEPFVGVDITSEQKIIEIMKSLAQQGKTILVVHHDLATIEAYFSRVILINQRLIAYGPTNDVFIKENIAKCYGPQLSLLHKTGLLGQ